MLPKQIQYTLPQKKITFSTSSSTYTLKTHTHTKHTLKHTHKTQKKKIIKKGSGRVIVDHCNE